MSFDTSYSNSEDEQQCSAVELQLPDVEGANGSTITTTVSGQPETKAEGKQQNTKPEGAIFGLLAVPPIVCLIIQYVMHIIVYVQEHVIELISMTFIVDEDAEPTGRSVPQNILLHIHACGAIFLMGFMIFQQISGLIISLDHRKRETWVRRGHRVNGPMAAAIWVFLIVSGFVMMPGLANVEKEDQRNKAILIGVVAGSGGIAMLINLWIGMRAVIPPGGDPAKKDYMLHKGSMFFAFVWVAYFTGPAVLSVNVAMWLMQCTLSYASQLFLFALSFTLVAGFSYLAGRRWGGPAFRRPFVTYNFAAILLFTVAFWVGYVLTSIPGVYSDNGVDGRCNLF